MQSISRYDRLITFGSVFTVNLMLQVKIASSNHEHHIFDQATIDAQPRLSSIQGRNRSWFCGANRLYLLAFHCADQAQAVSR